MKTKTNPSSSPITATESKVQTDVLRAIFDALTDAGLSPRQDTAAMSSAPAPAILFNGYDKLEVSDSGQFYLQGRCPRRIERLIFDAAEKVIFPAS